MISLFKPIMFNQNYQIYPNTLDLWIMQGHKRLQYEAFDHVKMQIECFNQCSSIPYSPSHKRTKTLKKSHLHMPQQQRYQQSLQCLSIH